MRGFPGFRALLGAIATVVALLAYAAPALAGRTQESIFQDDRLLTNSDFAVQSAALDKLAYLGVDEIHTVVNWRRFAPQPDSKKKPAGFIGTDSRSYGPTNWDIYDSLVRGAQLRGIRVFMSPAGPIPNWASGCRKNINFACKPNTKLFGEFVTALATRYSGTWIDEDQDQTALPRVSTWGVWNEPNLGAWLYPQSKRVKGKRIGVGAAYYRRLVYAADNALNATGHGGDQLLIGETAPLGAGPTRTEPGPFLRQLFCIDGKSKVLRGKAAKQQGCAKPKRMKATGISHHPYARGAGVPLSRKQRPGSITIGTIGRLLPIARATARSKVMKKRLPVYITEFGVTTRPPDRKFGVALTRQAQYLNVVDYLAFQKSWIKSVSQFQLEDDTGLADRGTFQTGLMFGTGKAKPSFQAYRIPIFVTKKKKRITVFGQVRPTRAGTAPPTIEIQNKPKGKQFKTVASRKTNARGYVLARFKARKGAWRIRWVEPNGTISFSRGSQAVPPSTPGNPGVPPPGPGTPPPPPPPGSDPGSPPPPGGGGAPPPPGGGSGTGGGGTGGGGGGTTEPPPPPPPAQFTLSVTMQFTNGLLGPASGTVTSSPAGINCTTGTCQKSFTDGTKVTLTATPGSQTTFDGWSGGGCTGTAPCTVTMSQARSVTASFSRTL